MRKICTKFYIWLISLPMLLSSFFNSVIPAYAIDIQVDRDGVKINPGEMPDMTRVDGVKDAVDQIVMPQVRSIGLAITSICTIICFAAFLISVTKLSASAGNPQARQRALTGILVSGIALALFGGAWVVVSFFWNFLSPGAATPTPST